MVTQSGWLAGEGEKKAGSFAGELPIDEVCSMRAPFLEREGIFRVSVYGAGGIYIRIHQAMRRRPSTHLCMSMSQRGRVEFMLHTFGHLTSGQATGQT